MLIVFGIGSSVQLMTALSYACERCGNYGQHNVLRERRRLSLFFVPVLPLGTSIFLGRLAGPAPGPADPARDARPGAASAAVPTWIRGVGL